MVEDSSSQFNPFYERLITNFQTPYAHTHTYTHTHTHTHARARARAHECYF